MSIILFAMSAIIVLSLYFCSSSRSSCISVTVVFGINPSEARYLIFDILLSGR